MKKNILSRMISAALIMVLSFQTAPSVFATSTTLLKDQRATTDTEVLYEEDFEDYGTGKITLEKGENKDYNLYLSGGTAYIENGRLHLSGSGYNTAYIMGGEMWAYYTVEADFGYTDNSTTWAGLNYYVQDASKWQKGSIKLNGQAKLNGYDTGWVNDSSSSNVKELNLALTTDDVVHLKIVANGTKASMYYRLNDDAEYTKAIDISNIPAASQSGSVGMVLSSGGMWMDNLKITRNTDQEAAKHTLLSVDFEEYTGNTADVLTAGSTGNPYDLSYIQGGNSTGSVELKDGRMYISGDRYDVVYFPRDDAQHWRDYIMEADMCYTSDSTTNSFCGMMYRVQKNGKTAQKGTIYYNKNQVSLNGFKGSIGSWDNDGTANGIQHKPTDILTSVVGADTQHRLKIVVNGDSADLWYALYDGDGKLGNWSYLMSINDISDAYESGTVGFMTSGNGNKVSFWVDNIEVYEYSTTYAENFDSYENTTLNVGANNGINGVGIQYVIDGGTTGGSLTVTDGELTLTATSDSATGKHDIAWFNAGMNWTNYTFETDVTYHNTNQWGTLLVRLDDKNNWVRAGVQPNTRIYLGTYLNGTWSNTENVDKWTITTGITLNKPFRVKIVVEDNNAYIYYAFYENGSLQPYTLLKSIDTITSAQYDGAIGFLGVKGASYSLDNIVVSAGPTQTEPEALTYGLADITIPETGIVNPPVVVLDVNKDNYASLGTSAPAVAIMNIDEEMNIVDGDEVIATAADYLDKYSDTVIPAFKVDSAVEASVLAGFLNANEVIDAFAVADSAKANLVKIVRQSCPKVRGILEYSKALDTYEKRAASRRLANNNLACVVILPEGSLNVSIASEYNVRCVNVWTYATDKGGVYDGVAIGSNAIIASDTILITDVYKEITTTTISGAPNAIGHRGYKETMYPENTISAYRHCIDECGGAGIEIDLKLSKDNEIVIMHDSTVDRTTDGTGNISSFTLEELKEMTVDSAAAYDRYDKIPTLEEIFKEFCDEEDVVIYCHMPYNTAMLARFKELVTAYEMEDNVVAFARYSNAASPYNNSDFGNGLSFIGGNSSGALDMSSSQACIRSLIDQLAPSNHQSMPYQYDSVSGGGKDAFYYALSVRGFVPLHSTIGSEVAMDKYCITTSGIVGGLTDYPDWVLKYYTEIPVAEETLEVGETIDLERIIKKTMSEETLECGLVWIGGDALESTADGYTMNSAGAAEVVYYADVTAGSVSYRLYSQPTTITFEMDGNSSGEAPDSSSGSPSSSFVSSSSTSSTEYMITVADVNNGSVSADR